MIANDLLVAFGSGFASAFTLILINKFCGKFCC